MLYTPRPETKALIFDLDGTLADTMPVHFEAWQQTCREYGVEMTREYLLEQMGRPVWDIAADFILINNIGDRVDAATLIREKVERFREMEQRIKGIPPVVEIVKRYHGKLPMAIGTGGFRKAAMRTLNMIGMTDYFDIIITADDVVNHKPHPETFLLCAEKLEVAPQGIDVFEDGKLGLLAAERAGMNPVDIRPWIAAW